MANYDSPGFVSPIPGDPAFSARPLTAPGTPGQGAGGPAPQVPVSGSQTVQVTNPGSGASWDQTGVHVDSGSTGGNSTGPADPGPTFGVALEPTGAGKGSAEHFPYGGRHA